MTYILVQPFMKSQKKLKISLILNGVFIVGLIGLGAQNLLLKSQANQALDNAQMNYELAQKAALEAEKQQKLAVEQVNLANRERVRATIQSQVAAAHSAYAELQEEKAEEAMKNARESKNQ